MDGLSTPGLIFPWGRHTALHNILTFLQTSDKLWGYPLGRSSFLSNSETGGGRAALCASLSTTIGWPEQKGRLCATCLNHRVYTEEHPSSIRSFTGITREERSNSAHPAPTTVHTLRILRGLGSPHQGIFSLWAQGSFTRWCASAGVGTSSTGGMVVYPGWCTGLYTHHGIPPIPTLVYTRRYLPYPPWCILGYTSHTHPGVYWAMPLIPPWVYWLCLSYHPGYTSHTPVGTPLTPVVPLLHPWYTRHTPWYTRHTLGYTRGLRGRILRKGCLSSLRIRENEAQRGALLPVNVVDPEAQRGGLSPWFFGILRRRVGPFLPAFGP